MRQLIVGGLLVIALASTPALRAWDASVEIDDEILNRFAAAVAASETTDTAVWRIESPRFAVTSSGIRLSGRLSAYVTYQGEPWKNYKALVSKQLEFVRRQPPASRARPETAEGTDVRSRTGRRSMRERQASGEQSVARPSATRQSSMPEMPTRQVPSGEASAVRRQAMTERVNPRELALLTRSRLNPQLSAAEIASVKRARRYTRLYSQPFDLSAALEASGQGVRLKVTGTVVAVHDETGETLASVRPADYFTTEIPLVLDGSEAGGVGIVPTVSGVQTTALDGAVRVRFNISF